MPKSYSEASEELRLEMRHISSPAAEVVIE
jgi:hypothetical protein